MSKSFRLQDRGTFLTIGTQDCRTPCPFCSGLLGHRILDRFDRVDLFYLHTFDFDTPLVGFPVKDVAELCVDHITIVQDLVKLHVPDDATEAGLGECDCCQPVVGDLKERLLRVNHPHIDDRIHVGRGVILCYNLLRRYFHDLRAQVKFDHFADKGNNPAESGV